MGDCMVSLLTIINIFLGNLFIYYYYYYYWPFFLGLLLIEVFECLHKQANVFLFDCVNVIWSFKRLEDSCFFVLVFFLHRCKDLPS
jgi:hypothetical protein